MSARVAVLGPGGVGGALAVRLALAGVRVVCVARPATAAAIARDGLTLAWQGDELVARPETVERLEEPVDLLLVTVKAPSLADALARVHPAAVVDGVVLPLLNGLEHMEAIRARLGRRAAAGSVSRFECYREGPARIVATTPAPAVTAASDDVSSDELRRAISPLEPAGIELRLAESESAVLWEKAVRLGPLAAVTALAQRPIGELRTDAEWRATLAAAIEESCAVAAADGTPVTSAAQWGIIDAMPAALTTSAARDVAAGRPSELDAIVGGVVRAGRRLGVPVPTLESLLARLDAA